jgi:hypothetical protein
VVSLARHVFRALNTIQGIIMDLETLHHVSNASASRRCNARRMADLHGMHLTIHSAESNCSDASAAHSPIAVNDRRPAITA